MKIAFIEPKAPDYNVYSKYLKKLPLLGNIYLGTILKNKGYDVKLYNENISKVDYSKLKEYDVLGVSIITSTAPRGYEIANNYKILNRDGKVIIGGVHATFMPEEAIRFADHVVRYEAEHNIVDLIKDGGEEIIDGKRIESLDDLPFPDFSLIEDYKGNITPISTSRGCPYKCNFCSVSPMFGRKYRYRSIDNVIDELKRQKNKWVFFVDDIFTANRKRTNELLEAIIKNNINIKWVTQARAKDIDKELANLMHRAGCYALCIGFESLNQETLDSYGKKQTVEEGRRCIDILRKANIKIHGMFLSEGYYDYDKENISTLQLTIETPLPGSNLFERVKNSRKFIKDFDPLENYKNWSLFDGQHVVHFSDKLSPKELQEQTVRALSRFYSKTKLLKLFLKGKFRDYYFRNIGYNLVKKWEENNKEFMKTLDYST